MLFSSPFKSTTDIKVKLVAIAKDEAAYLLEWIFHHLHFGFDSIDVYVNNTTDNTEQLASDLSNRLPVRFLDGDVLFAKDLLRPQQAVYTHGFERARKDGFSHVIFLDIDEFWTPLDGVTGIKDCIEKLGADVISFEWLNKFEGAEFSPALEVKLRGEHHRLVKSVFSTTLKIDEIDIHNIKSKDATYSLADGSIPEYRVNNQQIINSGSKLKPFFILHRMYRSQLEYVSMLGRGRPNTRRFTTKFKNNRDGFCLAKYDIVEVSFDNVVFEKYFNAKKDFYNQYQNKATLLSSRQFVIERFEHVNEMIRNAPPSELAVIKKILKNVTMPKVLQSYSIFLSNTCNLFERKLVDLMRDSAVLLEKRHLSKSLDLMEFAQMLRPKGGFIKKKVIEYRKKLKKDEIV